MNKFLSAGIIARPAQVRTLLPRWVVPTGASLCAALPLLHHAGWLEVSAALAVLTVTTAGALIARKQTHRQEAMQSATPDRSDEITALLRAVLPVWKRHVGSVKQQTEEAASQLIASFASMIQQFEQAGFGSIAGTDDAHGDMTASLLHLCERELRPVIGTLENVIGSKEALLTSIRALSAAVDEMTGMAEDVKLVASYTNLLAINAAIEAARAGTAGRGFAVVATEVRKLSHNSAETGTRISVRVQEITGIARDTLSAASRAAELDEKSLAGSGGIVQQVLDNVHKVGAAADLMRDQGLVIRRDIENLMVSLQYQDRISQILDVIADDMEHLCTAVDTTDATLPTPHQWLDRLSETYTMDDQRHNHRQTGGGHAAAQPMQDVTFF